MTEGVDPRLARRRREVQEASARRRLRWLIWLLVLAVVTGLVVAVFQSSWFAVDTITVEGVNRSDAATILEGAGIEEGVAIITVRAGNVEEELRGDPWVAEAQVRVVWPRTIEVNVVEYIPIARVKSGATWLVTSGQGAVLVRGQRLVDPLIDIEAGDLQAGERVDDPLILGALEFVAALPIELKDGLEVVERNGDLEATVGGYQVELGSTQDMAQKAVTLAVLLEEDLAAGSVISVVSPLRPAVANPQPEVEPEPEEADETTGSG